MTIRLAGSTNLGPAQMAALENLVTEIWGKRYTVKVPDNRGQRLQSSSCRAGGLTTEQVVTHR